MRNPLAALVPALCCSAIPAQEPAAAATPDLPPAQSPAPLELQAYWDQGLRLETADRRFQLRMGGRIQIDSSAMDGTGEIGSTFSTDPPGIIEDGAEIRRARLYAAGSFLEDLLYRFDYDFSSGQAIAAYLGWASTPLGELRVGFQKEPLSLDHVTSSNDITLIERGLPVELASFRSIGIETIDSLDSGRMYWSVGLFGPSSSASGDSFGEGGGAVTARITGLPVFEDDGRQLVHLGIGGSYRNPSDDPVTLTQRPETHLAPPLISTGELVPDTISIYTFEAAAVFGPLSIQGEYIGAHVENVGAPDSMLQGYYGYVSWFLTGEHRPYLTDQGHFTVVHPLANFDPRTGGSGALELALRYSSLSYEDVTNPDETLNDWTVGINWYLNPNSRVMLDYVDGQLDNLTGAFRSLTLRFQVSF